MFESQNELNNWGLNLIKSAIAFSEKSCRNKISTAVFYSPLRYNPKLMIVGENPGGVEINSLQIIPENHEYLTNQYPLAKQMREKIMAGDELKMILENSVKLNRIFYRTKNMKEFYALKSYRELESYCFAKFEEIIYRLRPEKIMAESFSTFSALSKNFEVILTKEKSDKALILLGDFNGIDVIGINHPTSARGISNKDWEQVNKSLKSLI